ncbi:hypothetical protein D9611_014836 [Ephemerocybe angulata]|uniref:Uncharacterized protein n=1 Tax=Ephemerocybe angulata TaxID=980116 RepID=A0A8H5F9C4_9AGAR|nr:hypothetical protein D9611_014836 [Tulosesus angulatus]
MDPQVPQPSSKTPPEFLRYTPEPETTSNPTPVPNPIPSSHLPSGSQPAANPEPETRNLRKRKADIDYRKSGNPDAHPAERFRLPPSLKKVTRERKNSRNHARRKTLQASFHDYRDTPAWSSEDSDPRARISTWIFSPPHIELQHKWINLGFANIGNTDILRALYAELMLMKARVYIRKVKGHSNDEGNDGADLEANRGANKDTPDNIDTSAGTLIQKLGAASRAMTQKTAYQHIRAIKHKTEHRRTYLMVEMTKATILDTSGIEPTAQAIWRSLQKRRGTALSLKFTAFAWRGLHDSHKVGKFWEHIAAVRDTHMPCRSCGVPEESMSHILPSPDKKQSGNSLEKHGNTLTWSSPTSHSA